MYLPDPRNNSVSLPWITVFVKGFHLRRLIGGGRVLSGDPSDSPPVCYPLRQEVGGRLLKTCLPSTHAVVIGSPGGSSSQMATG